MTGLTGNDADTGVARGPALALALRRRAGVETPLPVGEAYPHAADEMAGSLGAGHDRHRSKAALDQSLGTLRIGAHHAIRI